MKDPMNRTTLYMIKYTAYYSQQCCVSITYNIDTYIHVYTTVHALQYHPMGANLDIISQ